MSWTETGGSPVAPPSHRGSGSRLIEQGLRYHLEGEVRLDFCPAGLHCAIEARLAAGADEIERGLRLSAADEGI